jgi:tRNA (guanine6-N2)-methyltransferase
MRGIPTVRRVASQFSIEDSGAAERPFLARAVRGLEDVCAAEVAERVHGRQIAVTHRGVSFNSRSGFVDVTGLRTADDVFLTLGTLVGVTHERAALDQLRRRALEMDLDAALQWIGAARPVRPERGFQVVSSFLGRRNFTRYDIEDAVGGAIASRTRMLLKPVRERALPLPDLSFRVHLDGTAAVFGIRAAAAPLWQRAYKERSVPGSLHPPVAYGLTRIAGLPTGGTLLDPFCGAGTIAIEAALATPEGRFLAMDLSPEALAVCVENTRRAGLSLPLARADAARIPLASGSVDRVVSNPPWLKQVGYRGRLAKDRQAFWTELARVLAHPGAALLLGLTAQDDALLAAAGLRRSEAARLSLFGTWTEASLVTAC